MSARASVTLAWAAAALLSATAVALHVVRASSAGALWRDEAGALAVAKLASVGEMLRWFAHEAFPLAFPLLVRAWMEVAGDGDAALRLFGAAVAGCLLVALWVNARAAGTLPLASLALFVLLPLAVSVVPAIRGYGIACTMVVLALAAHARLAERVDGPRLLAAGVASLLAAHVALHDAVLLLAMGLAAATAALVAGRRAAAAAILGCDAAVAATLAIYARPLQAARDWDRSQVGEVSWSQLLDGALAALGGRAIAILWLGAMLAGLVAGFREWRRSNGAERDRLLYLLLVVPLALLAYGAWLKVLGYLPRTWYYLPLLALVAAAIDAQLGLSRIGRRGWTLAVVAVAGLGVGAWSARGALESARLCASNVDHVAAELAARAGARDLVVVNPWFYGVSFARYYRGAAPWVTMPAIPDHRFHRYDLLLRRMSDRDGARGTLSRVRNTLRRGGTVFLVGAYDVPPNGQRVRRLPPAPNPRTGWLDAPYVRTWSQQLGSELAARAGVRRRLLPLADQCTGLESLAIHAFRRSRARRQPGLPAAAPTRAEPPATPAPP